MQRREDGVEQEIGRTIEAASLREEPASEADERNLVEQQEHAANVRRLRAAVTPVLAVWPAFMILDAVVDAYIQPGVLLPLAILRVVYMPVIGLSVLRLWRAPMPSRGMLRVIQLLTFGGASLCIGLMCIWYGGLASSYVLGVGCTIACAPVAIAEPWRRGTLLVGVAALAGPLALLGTAPFVPELRAELADPAAVAGFGQHLMIVLTIGLFSLLSSHVQWSLRRQVFESRSIGRYRLERRLGKGGMGEVWAAWHNGLRRSVALKLLRATDARPSAVARFEREVAAMSELTHPNTVRVFDYGVTDDGIWYYAMELLEGEDLGHMLQREGPLPVERAAHLVWQAARALAEAHARGTVHRDIKPENLFVTVAGMERDFVKVLDFGIAKRAGRDATLTQAGWMGGTPSYMSPEAAAGLATDARSDVYALGLVLYALLAGGPPFDGDNAAKILYAQIHERPPLLSRWVGAVPQDLDEVLARCLAKAPADRYADAGALADALAACDCFGRWDPERGASVATEDRLLESPARDSSAETFDGPVQVGRAREAS